MWGGTVRIGETMPGSTRPSVRLWQRLYLRPLPHQHGSFACGNVPGGLAIVRIRSSSLRTIVATTTLRSSRLPPRPLRAARFCVREQDRFVVFAHTEAGRHLQRQADLDDAAGAVEHTHRALVGHDDALGDRQPE